MKARGTGCPGSNAAAFLLWSAMVFLGGLACTVSNNAVDFEGMADLPSGVGVVYPFTEDIPIASGGGKKTRVFIFYPHNGAKKLLLKAKGSIPYLSSSPEGGHIAFTFRKGELGAADQTFVYLLSLRDGRLKEISSLDSRIYKRIPPLAFSPDGAMLAFAAETPYAGRQKRLFIYTLGDGTLHSPEALDSVTLDENPPQFAPTGREIACTIKYYKATGYLEDFERQLIAYDLGSGTYRVLAEFDMDSRLGVPYYGPGGQYIYFDYSHAAWTTHRVIKRVPVEGGEPETVFEEDYVLWLCGFVPDAGLALMSYIVQETMQRYIAIGELETGTVRLLTSGDEDIELFSGNGLQHLSPDGKLILAHYHDRTFDYWDILAMDIDGGSRVNVSGTATVDEDYATWVVVPQGIKIPQGGYEVP
jgi:Tol biopolymer transport system component